MRLLLDENLPRRLKQDFPEHQVFTVRDKGWNGVKNGALLKLMITDGFDGLLTFDKNMAHQQNFAHYPIFVLILHAPANTYETLTTLSSRVREALTEQPLPAGPRVISTES